VDASHWLQLLYFERYPLLGGALLLFLAPFAVFSNNPIRRLLANVFLLANWQQLAILVLVCLATATLVVLHGHAIYADAPLRFWNEPLTTAPPETLHAGWSWSLWKTGLWLALGMTIPLVSVLHSLMTRSEAPKPSERAMNISVPEVFGGIAAGIGLFAALLLLMTWLNHHSLSSAVTIPHWLPISLGDAPPHIAGHGLVEEAFLRLGAGYAARDSAGAISIAPGQLQLVLEGRAMMPPL